MPEKTSPATTQTTRGEIGRTDDSLPTPWGVENLRAAGYGRITHEFDLVVGGVRLIGCKLVAGGDGKPSFVAPPSVKEAYSQTYRATAKFERSFAGELFDRVCAMLAPAPAIREPQPERTPRPKPAPSGEKMAWVHEQERRFDAALDDLRRSA